MTTEKLQELTQARLAHFGEHFSDEAMTVYLKVMRRTGLLTAMN